MLSGEDAPRKLEQSLVVGARLATRITGRYKKIGDSGRIAITTIWICQQALAGSSTAMASVAACYGRLLEDNRSSSVVRNSPLSQPTGPAISMPVMQSLLPVLQNPLSLTTLQAPSNHNDRKEKNGIRNRLLVVFYACSVSLPYLFRISPPSPTCLAGEEPTLGLGKCA